MHSLGGTDAHRLMRKITSSPCCFALRRRAYFIGGIALYENIDYRLHGPAGDDGACRPRQEDHKFVRRDRCQYRRRALCQPGSPFGSFHESASLVRSPVNFRRLCIKIPVTYLTNNPQHAEFTEVERPNPWGWLALGFLVLLATFVYAVKLIRRESAVTGATGAVCG